MTRRDLSSGPLNGGEATMGCGPRRAELVRRSERTASVFLQQAQRRNVTRRDLSSGPLNGGEARMGCGPRRAKLVRRSERTASVFFVVDGSANMFSEHRAMWVSKFL